MAPRVGNSAFLQKYRDKSVPTKSISQLEDNAVENIQDEMQKSVNRTFRIFQSGSTTLVDTVRPSRKIYRGKNDRNQSVKPKTS